MQLGKPMAMGILSFWHREQNDNNVHFMAVYWRNGLLIFNWGKPRLSKYKSHGGIRGAKLIVFPPILKETQNLLNCRSAAKCTSTISREAERDSSIY